ncbi:MAG: hypothetical protein KC656_02140 [Myxococcales bacterium]|nr:hypothetical protein [Myxococcales bacterium]
MLANDALSTLVSLLFFTSPLFLVWFAALGVGVWLLGQNRGAGLALMAAGTLELLRLSMNLAAVPLPVLLIESRTLGLEGLKWFGLFRALVSVAMTVASHVLLLVAIFGFRTPPPEP